MNRLTKEIISSAVSRIEATGVDTIKQRYRFGPDFIGFKGHFPGNPILPAIVQIRIAMTMIEKHKGYRLVLAGVEKAKFQMPLLPDQEIEVACRQQTGSELQKFNVRLLVSERLAASYWISFSGRDHGK